MLTSIQVYQHNMKMNFLVFTFFILVAVIQGAWAIRCHQCQPDPASLTTAIQNNNLGGLSLCSKPTDTFDCSQDPVIGGIADSCYTVDITLNTTFPIGDIQLYMLNCSVRSSCSMLKDQACGSLQTVFAGIPMVGIKNCDISCCEDDLCNNPSGSATANTTTSPNTATTPNTTTTLSAATSPTVKSSVKITSIPPNAALFGIFGLISVTFMHVF